MPKPPTPKRPCPEGSPMPILWDLQEDDRVQREERDYRMGFYGPHQERLDAFVAERSKGEEVDDWPAFTIDCIRALQAIDAELDASEEGSDG